MTVAFWNILFNSYKRRHRSGNVPLFSSIAGSGLHMLNPSLKFLPLQNLINHMSLFFRVTKLLKKKYNFTLLFKSVFFNKPDASCSSSFPAGIQVAIAIAIATKTKTFLYIFFAFSGCFFVLRLLVCGFLH